LGALKIELKLDPIIQTSLYAQIDGCNEFNSTDSGSTWQNVQNDACGWNYSMPREGGQIAVDPNNPDKVYALYDRDQPPYIYFSDDGGKTWQESEGMQDINGTRLIFENNPDGLIYAVGDLDISRSEDHGKTWTNCPDTNIWSSQADARMIIDPRDNQRLILATRGNGILISQSGCQSWEESNQGLGSMFVNTITADPNNPDTLYASTDSGAYISSDSGETWGQINDGLLGATVVYSIVVDSESNVYAATPYGIFKLESK
jgi:photosystem II stability/assembly factor-like uncharacterized protein